MATTSYKTAINAPCVDALREIIRSLTYDPDHLTVEAKTDVADRLGQMVGKPWGWRYIHNVLHGKINASKELQDAIIRLGASIDGMPEILAKSRPVQCLAIGDVRPGALILADSRRCGYPPCGIWFVPTAKHQRYHSIECKRAWERHVKRMKRQEQNGH